MSTKHDANQEIDRLSKRLAELVETFRKGKAACDFRFWNDMSNLFRPYFGYQEGQVLFNDVVRSIIKLNAEMLSENFIKQKLVYGFLQEQNLSELKQQWLYGEYLKNEAREKICELVDFTETHCIEIPIFNLVLLKNEQYNLLGITLRKATENDVKHYDKEFKGVGLSRSYVHSFACVQMKGDKYICTSKAIEKVRYFFDIIRAFCFPFGRGNEAYNTGIFGDIPMRSSIPIIIDQFEYSFLSNQRNQQIELENHVLPKLTDEQWGLIDEICKKKTTTQMQKKLRDSIHWLAEATKPDTNNAKFMKISIALETLLGKEPKDEDLKVRGITAMLAERAAFIAGSNLNDRLNIDQKIRYFYGKRSDIAHGSGKEVSSEDVDEFGNLIRRISLAILEDFTTDKENIEDIGKLEIWLKKQKYTLTEN